MNILLVYATYSSGTENASELVEKTLTQKGHTVTRKHVLHTDPNELSSFDLLVFGTPSWLVNGKEGQPHETYFPFMESLKAVDLAGKKVAVFGLGDSAYNTLCGGAIILTDFFKSKNVELIADTLKIDGFFFEPDKNEKLLTDWAEKLVN